MDCNVNYSRDNSLVHDCCIDQIHNDPHMVRPEATSMIEKIIEKFTADFSLTQEFVDDGTNFALGTTCKIKDKVIYVNSIDLTPMYEAFEKRMNQQNK